MMKKNKINISKELLTCSDKKGQSQTHRRLKSISEESRYIYRAEGQRT